MTAPAIKDARKKTGRCQSCRWWERSNNFAAEGRDWGLCHFWGKRQGARIPGGFIDYTVGHEPRGAMTCDQHDASPVWRGHDGLKPPTVICCEGEPS